MDILDVIILLAAIVYGIGGFRSGAVVGVCSLVGFFGGAILGAQLARPLGSRLADGRAQVPVAIFCVLLVATLGQVIGVYLAGLIRDKIVRQRGKKLDSGIGSLLGVLSVLLVAWMVAVPLASSPFPVLASEASHSRIVRAVNGVIPGDVRNLYSSLRGFLDQSGFPPVFGDLPSTSIVSVAPPDESLSPAVQRRIRVARGSIFKVLGQAPSCNRGIEGSGFLYAPQHIVTNAHVVAGTSQVAVVISARETLAATVVVFDPQRDVAVLDVPGLDARPLRFAKSPASAGQPALVLGYPENGPFTARAARVRSRSAVSGTDIYGEGYVRRDIYSIRSIVRSGNSGGPLLADDGTVLGIVFATALDSADTGFALSDDEIATDVSQGRNAESPVPTGACTPG